jgi:nitroreductase
MIAGPDVSRAGKRPERCKTLGFDSCPMGGFDPKEFARILKIPPPLVPVMPCPIGYAADRPMPKARFEKRISCSETRGRFFFH